jgi:hypothetical protein
MGLTSILVEGNHKTCVNAISSNGEDVDWRIKDYILVDICSFDQVICFSSFSWIFREVNRAAHVLGRWALLNSFVGWVQDPLPASFASALEEDASFL